MIRSPRKDPERRIRSSFLLPSPTCHLKVGSICGVTQVGSLARSRMHLTIPGGLQAYGSKIDYRSRASDNFLTCLALGPFSMALSMLSRERKNLWR